MSVSEPDPTPPPIPPPTPGTPGSTLARAASGAEGASHDPDRVPWGRALPGGTKVGDYTIQAPLAAGGMGVVYIAQQAQPQRTVALKLVRPGLASARMLRRFELEAETLGRLQHPGIAQIYEAGTFDLGEGPQPFFAMEFVVGVPLTQYAKQKNLGTRQRLELAAKIADAVQHAHQRGVVHRDLKPSNILVTDEGQPKILDFGVARLTDSDTTATTLNTDIGQLVGTLPYMSPEQASGDPAQIDTRSDVYALGVVIYELLVDRLPHDVAKKMMVEAARIIREEEPTRLSSLNTSLRGDVETIVGHALEKDKERRYQSASALAADIRRYLSDEPISARPASTWYQLAKFSRRNKGLVGGVLAAFIALAAGLVVSLWQARVAQREAARADDRALAAQKAEAEEKARADELKKVAVFQSDMFRRVSPESGGTILVQELTTRFGAAMEKREPNEPERRAQQEAFRSQLATVNATDTAMALIEAMILKPAETEIDARFREQPLIAARLRTALASTCVELGLYETGARLQLAALQSSRAALGDDHEDTVACLLQLGTLYREMDRLTEADEYCAQALERSRSLWGSAHKVTLTAAHTRGGIMMHLGQYAEAESLLREALAGRRSLFGSDDIQTIGSMNDLAATLSLQSKYAEAEVLAKEAAEVSARVRGEAHPETLTTLSVYAFSLQAQGKVAESEPLARRCLELRRRVQGEEHPDTIVAQQNLAYVLSALGKHDEAERLLRDMIPKVQRTLGRGHRSTLTAQRTLGTLLQQRGRFAEAESTLRESLAGARESLGNEHPDTLTSLGMLGAVTYLQGKLDEAEAFMNEALGTRRRVLGGDHQDTLTSLNDMTMLLRARNRLDEAETITREVVERRSRLFGKDHPQTITTIGNLGTILFLQSRYDEAEAYIRDAYERCARLYGADHPSSLTWQVNNAKALQALQRPGEAEALCRDAIERLSRVVGPLHPDTLGAKAILGNMLIEREDFEDAQTLLMPAATAATESLPARHQTRQSLTAGMVVLYTKWNAQTPGQGYDANAAEWQTKLDVIKPKPQLPPAGQGAPASTPTPPVPSPR